MRHGVDVAGAGSGPGLRHCSLLPLVDMAPRRPSGCAADNTGFGWKAYKKPPMSLNINGAV
jgi:hypothetical protein